MANIQVRDVPEPVRRALAAAARSHGQSMQAYLLALLEEDARRASNVALLRRVRETGAGHVAEPGDTAAEMAAIRSGRDQRNTGTA